MTQLNKFEDIYMKFLSLEIRMTQLNKQWFYKFRDWNDILEQV
jgi:hypothetical protein